VLLQLAARRRRDSVSLATLAGVVIAAIAVNFATHGARSVISLRTVLVLLVAAVVQAIFSAWNARCPACNQHIGRLIAFAHFCPHCGTQFQSSDANVG
jgi:uncharacterized membrane protein